MSNVRRKLGPLTVDIPAIIIGVQILLKGSEKLADFGHHPFLVTSLLLLGGFVVVGAFLSLWLEKRIQNAHALFHAAEGVALGLLAIVLLEKGKLRMPLLLLLIALFYLVLGIVESRPPARRAQLVGPMLRSFGWAYLAAGLLLAGSTALGDHNVWAFGTAGFLAIIGAALLLLRPRLVPRLAGPAGGDAQADTH
jgi:hypothetical protein